MAKTAWGEMDEDADDELFRVRLPEGSLVTFNGEILGDATGLLHQFQEKLENLRNELDFKLRKINRLQKESDKALRNSPYFQDAVVVLRYWRDLCHQNARELEGGERLKNVITRLSGRPKPYSVDELKRSVYGYSKFPYVVDGRRMSAGTPARRFIDAELIFRDPKHVDVGIALANEADHREAIMPEIVKPEDGVQLSELGQAAVTMADFGFYVFPVAIKAKFPVTPHGLKDATRDTDRIMVFWRAHPNHNVAVRCGQESDIVVLDVDGDDGFESLRILEKENEKLPKTLSVKTPSGGQHFYFHWPSIEIRNTAGFPAYGLDIRGDGGYVLAPPSIGPNDRRYEVDERVMIADMPKWLTVKLVEFQRAMEKVDVGEYEKLFDGVPPGMRNSKMTQYVGRLYHKHTPREVLGLALAVNHDYCTPPLPDKEIKKIWESIVRREQNQQDHEVEMRNLGAA